MFFFFLFFFFYKKKIGARYNAERFDNGLKRCKPLNNFREHISEGYFPTILQHSSDRSYAGRLNDLALKDVNRKQQKTRIAQLERWRYRILQAIDLGYVIEQHTNRRIPLNETHGIDLLDDIMESTPFSPNRRLYGKYV